MSAMRVLALLVLGLSVSACAGFRSDVEPAAEGDASASPAPDGLAEQSTEIAQLREVAAPSGTGSPDDIICRREVRTGSHFSTRVCRTRAEMEAAREDSQEFLRDRQSRSGIGGSGGESAQ